MAAKLEKISDSELLIMTIIWSSDTDPDLKKIQELAKIRFKKDWKLQTIATFMTRLEKKGHVFIYKVGRYSYYQALVSKEEYRDRVMKEMFELLYDNRLETLLEFAVELKNLSKAPGSKINREIAPSTLYELAADE